MQFRRRIEESCKAISSESGNALRILASSLKKMTNPSSSSSKSHIENAKIAIDELKTTLKSGYLETSDLLGIIPDATVCCILIDIVKSVEKISEAIDELGRLANFKSVEPTVSPETKPSLSSSQLLHRGIVNPVFDGGEGGGECDDHHVVIMVDHDEVENIGKSTTQANSEVKKPKQRGDHGVYV